MKDVRSRMEWWHTQGEKCTKRVGMADLMSLWQLAFTASSCNRSPEKQLVVTSMRINSCTGVVILQILDTN